MLEWAYLCILSVVWVWCGARDLWRDTSSLCSHSGLTSVTLELLDEDGDTRVNLCNFDSERLTTRASDPRSSLRKVPQPRQVQ